MRGSIIGTDASHTGGIHVAELQLNDLTPAFGTEIIGLDPVAALADADTTRRLRELFDNRGVLVFRDVDIDQPTQANLSRALIGMGPLAEGESGSARPNGDPFYVSNKEPDGGAPFGRLLDSLKRNQRIDPAQCTQRDCGILRRRRLGIRQRESPTRRTARNRGRCGG